MTENNHNNFKELSSLQATIEGPQLTIKKREETDTDMFLRRCYQEDREADTRMWEAKAHTNYMPNEVNIQISRRCNIRCKMCGWEAWERNTGSMSFDLFKHVIRELKTNEIGKIHLTSAQGEPLLNPNAFEFMAHAIDEGLSVFFSTNGTTLSQTNITKICALAQKGDLTMIASFAGYDKESYEKVYDGANFENVSRNIKLLNEQLQAIGRQDILEIRGVIFNSNQKQPSIDFLKGLGVEENRIHIVLPDNFAGKIEVGRKSSRHNVFSLKTRLSERPLRLCSILLNIMVVYDDGKVSACGCRDSEGVMNIGDLTKESFKNICNSEMYKSMIQSHLDRNIDSMPLCRSCDVPYGEPQQYPDPKREIEHAIADGKFEKALKLIEKELLQDPNKTIHVEQHIRVNKMMGQVPRALKSATRLVELLPTDMSIRLLRANLQYELQMWSGALNDYETILSSTPSEISVSFEEIIANRDFVQRKIQENTSCT